MLELPRTQQSLGKVAGISVTNAPNKLLQSVI